MILHTGRVKRLAPIALLVLLATACTATDEEPEAERDSTPSADAAAGGPDPSADAAAESEPADPPHPVSLAALAATDLDGGRLRVGAEVGGTERHTQYAVTYRSGGLTVSGRLAVPRGKGPFPTVVLAHGYIDPAIYANGQGMTRERAWFAERGYVALHVDYRGHAASDEDPSGGLDMRMGYTEDTLNAVLALREWDGPVDDDRVALVGRSMGGGVVYNALVAKPGLVDAGVVFAPVSSNAVDNFERWIRPDPSRGAVARRILDAYGEPDENPGFWEGISADASFDQITEPVLIHHGTADDTCPIRWSRETTRAMRQAGVDVTLEVYDGEQHAFGPQFERSMERTERFLRESLA